MKWEGLSQEAKEVMDELGDFGPTVNASNRTVKGQMARWQDGEIYRVYHTSDYLRKIASACEEVADWLDKRAEEEGK